MTTLTFLPMIALAVVLIGAIGTFAFIILRRGKMRRRVTAETDPATATHEWLEREAENAKKPH